MSKQQTEPIMNAPENTLSRLALAAAAQPLHTVAPGTRPGLS